jgi:hypothetical protein
MELNFSSGHWNVHPAGSHETHSAVWPLANGTTALVSSADNAHLLIQTMTSNYWPTAVDLTTTIGAPLVDGIPVGYRRSDNFDCIVYARTDYHIEEVAFYNGGWHAGDLTANAHAPITDEVYLFPYVRADGVNSIPYERGGHIYDLFLGPGVWQYLDVTANATPQ